MDVLNGRDREGNTPLALAIYSVRTPQVRMLLEAGCHTDYRDRTNGTVLHYCAQEGGIVAEYVPLLLEHGADHTLRDEVRRVVPLCSHAFLCSTDSAPYAVR